MLRAALLGTGGMMPLPNRKLTAMIANSGGSSLLIDCGEGTQVALKSLGWGIKNIDVICLTHYHPDHILGLPGLLSTMGNSDRKEPVTIIGPCGLNRIIDSLNILIPYLPFKINIIELSNKNINKIKYGVFEISACRLEHSVECMGYSINIKRNKKFIREKAEKLNIPVKYWSVLQKNEPVNVDGIDFTPDMVLGEERNGLKISYCTDTRPTDKMIDFAKDSDLFICEGMYGEDVYLEKAQSNKHMLFSEAAFIADKANVKELWLTHFSPSLVNPEQYLGIAKKYYNNTKIGKELMSEEFKFR